MYTHLVRSTSWLALLGIIVFINVGTALIERHMEIIVTPSSAVSCEYTTIPEMPKLPEPSVGEYSAIIEQTMFAHDNLWQRDIWCFWLDGASGLIQPNEEVSNLNIFDNVFGIPTDSPSPLKNPESHEPNFDIPDATRADSTVKSIEEDEPVLYLKEEQEKITRFGTEQYNSNNDTSETPSIQNNDKTIDKVRTSKPPKQVMTKIRTKIKCVETILKKAVIEPYLINGQIEGLRITGLDRILLAKDLLLKSGDIIRTVNGHPLNSKRRAYQVFKRARKQPIMKVELLRDGKTRTLLYYLK
jgi:hypothetical protein